MIVPPHAFHVPQASVDGARMVAWLVWFGVSVRGLWLLLRRKR